MIVDRIAQQLGITNLRDSITTIVPRYLASATTMSFSAGCQLLWFIILARGLGVAHFGELMVITGVNTMAATVCTWGSGEVIVRRTSQRKSDFALMLGHGLLLIGAVGTILVIMAVFLLRLLVADQSVTTISLALFSVTQILVFSFVNLATSAFIGLGDFRLANLIEAGSSVTRLLSASIACLVFDVTTLDDWALWTTYANLILALTCGLLLRPFGPPVWRIDRRELGLGFHHSTPLFVHTVRFNVGRVALGMVVPPSTLGVYAAAMRITLVSNTVVSSLNRIIYPKFAKRIARGIAGSFRLAIAYALVVTVLSTSTASGVYLIAPYLPILLGEAYHGVVFDLQVLCWLIIPMAITTVPYDILGAMEQHNLRAKVHNRILLIGAAGIALSIFFFGVMGAFVSFYIVEIALLAGIWMAFVRVAAEDVPCRATSPPNLQLLERAFRLTANAFPKRKGKRKDATTTSRSV